MSLFAKRLKELRLDHSLTLKKIASLLNVSHVSYLRWEQGKTEPSSIAIILELCRILDVSADYLLGNEDALI